MLAKVGRKLYTGEWKGFLSVRGIKGESEMDFFERIGDNINAKGREAADKMKEFVEVANLKSQISTCEDVIKKNYLEIGRLYYEQYKDVQDAPFEKQCRAIRNAKRGVEELQEKIREVKGL